MTLTTLTEWSNYIATIHALPMALGLERISIVASRLNLLKPSASVITVGGTNGKGSTVAGLAAIYSTQGLKVGAFTSPYLFRLNEEFCINGEEIDDHTLCAAFSQIEAARLDIPLTVFEFNTLAALLIFKTARCNVIILEVGLGGRLDAVNIITADVAVITSIAIDHAEILGATRELIAVEKAGIFRPGKPVICGDDNPPTSLEQQANSIGAPFFCCGRDFHFVDAGATWEWSSHVTQLRDLPKPMLALANMATVLMTVAQLQSVIPVDRTAIDNALKNVFLAGRIQVVPGSIPKIFDVSHNPAAVEKLAEQLNTLAPTGDTHAVFSMLADKDIGSVLSIIKPCITRWHVAALAVPRGASLDKMQSVFTQQAVTALTTYTTIELAYQGALGCAKPGDRIVIFGSFYTVAAVFTSA